MSIKVGDKIKVLDRGCKSFGDIVEVLCVKDSNVYIYNESDTKGHCGSYCSCGENHRWVIGPSEYEIITSKITSMSILQKFNNLFVSEPEKSFRKAGITDSSGNLTDDGNTVFLTWLLRKNGSEFKTEIVDPIIAEMNKEE